MSYHLHLFRPVPDQDPLKTVNTLLDAEEESEEINPGLPDAEKERIKHRIAVCLIEINSSLSICQYDFDAIAEIENVTVEAAKIRHRELTLDGGEDSNGIQITVYDDGADITVPYWHSGEKAIDIIGEIWRYLKVFQQEGLAVYAPQMEQILNLGQDFDAVVETYGDGVT